VPRMGFIWGAYGLFGVAYKVVDASATWEGVVGR